MITAMPMVKAMAMANCRITRASRSREPARPPPGERVEASTLAAWKRDRTKAG